MTGPIFEPLWLTPDDMATKVAETDSAVFLSPQNYGQVRTEKYGLVSSVGIDLPWMEERVANGKCKVEMFGIANELGGAPLPELAALVRTDICPIYVWLNDRPPGWLELAMQQFAVTFPVHEELEGNLRYICSGPLTNFPGGIVIPGKSVNVGRNMPCHCGSGIKHKKCCGA